MVPFPSFIVLKEIRASIVNKKASRLIKIMKKLYLSRSKEYILCTEQFDFTHCKLAGVLLAEEEVRTYFLIRELIGNKLLVESSWTHAECLGKSFLKRHAPNTLNHRVHLILSIGIKQGLHHLVCLAV